MKRSLSLLLALLLVISSLALVACANSTPDAPSVDPDTPSTPDDAPAEPDAVQRIPLELPDRDLTGERVHIMQWSVSGVVDSSTGWIPWEEGDVVEHMTFGRGEILSAKVVGADTLYEIAFEKVGTKKLMASFAKLKKV